MEGGDGGGKWLEKGDGDGGVEMVKKEVVVVRGCWLEVVAVMAMVGQREGRRWWSGGGWLVRKMEEGEIEIRRDRLIRESE